MPDIFPTYLRDVESLVASQPDFIAITNAANHRLGTIKHLRNCLVPILIEKPLASTVREAGLVLREVEKKSHRAVVGYNLRFTVGIECVKRLLTDQMIGEILHVSCIVGQSLEQWRPGRDFKQTVSASRQRGGGVLRELSHEFDYLTYLLGSMKICSGVLATRLYKDLDVEDVAHVHLTLGSDGQAVPCSVIMDFVRHDPVRKVEFVGGDGTLVWNILDGCVDIFGKGDVTKSCLNKPDDVQDSYKNMWNAFLDGQHHKFASPREASLVMDNVARIEELAAVS
jgi:predicted dehydrogenase